jgi:hypothetical protein
VIDCSQAFPPTYSTSLLGWSCSNNVGKTRDDNNLNVWLYLIIICLGFFWQFFNQNLLRCYQQRIRRSLCILFTALYYCSKRVNSFIRYYRTSSSVILTIATPSILGTGASKYRRLSLPQYCSYPLMFCTGIYRFLKLFNTAQRLKLNSHKARRYSEYTPGLSWNSTGTAGLNCPQPRGLKSVIFMAALHAVYLTISSPCNSPE